MLSIEEMYSNAIFLCIYEEMNRCDKKKASSLVLVFRWHQAVRHLGSTCVQETSSCPSRERPRMVWLMLKLRTRSRLQQSAFLQDREVPWACVTNSIKHLSTTLYQVLSPPFKVAARGRTVSWSSKRICLFSRLLWKCPSVPTEPYLQQRWMCLSSVINALP